MIKLRLVVIDFLIAKDIISSSVIGVLKKNCMFCPLSII